MATYVIWIELDEAKIFRLSPTGETAYEVQTRQEFPRPPGCDDPLLSGDFAGDPFFEAVAGRIPSTAEVVLLGPEWLQLRLKRYLEKKSSEINWVGEVLAAGSPRLPEI